MNQFLQSLRLVLPFVNAGLPAAATHGDGCVADVQAPPLDLSPALSPLLAVPEGGGRGRPRRRARVKEVEAVVRSRRGELGRAAGSRRHGFVGDGRLRQSDELFPEALMIVHIDG